MRHRYCLDIRNVSVDIYSDSGVLHPVKNVSLQVPEGKILGIVGESGSGKSLLARTIMRLADQRKNNINCRGEIWFDGINLMTLGEQDMRPWRGRRISMVFQDPMTSLNPVLPVGWQVSEVFTTHLNCSNREAKSKALELFNQLGLAEADKLYHRFPHQLSGGMKQRVMIAIAIALQPALIIADEPTTALDVTLQAQILSQLKRLQQDYGTTIIIISHDMGVIAGIADHVAVMKQGQIVEYNDCYSLFDAPQHPYTKKLLAASCLEPGQWSQ